MDKDILDLRPQRLEDYIGQEKLKEKLTISIDAAKARKESLDHLLLYGPPGLGKTTVAKVLAKQLGVNIKVTSGPVLEKVGDIASILMSLQENDILFIDEIHRINRSVEELLYPAMEERKIDLIIGKGPTAKSVRFSLKKFTMVAATTKASLLSAPLRDRFGIIHRLEYYTLEELCKIIRKNANILMLNLNEESASEIAIRSRGTPRIANRLLKRLRDYVQVKKVKIVNLEITKDALNILEVDSFGLNELDRAILEVIIDKYSGGPVGLTSISMAIGEDSRTIEEVHEPYLVQIGFINRTKKGRMATELAYKHLKRA